MNNYELHDQAQAMADSMSSYELARALIEERQQTAALRSTVAEIREAAGNGKRLIQDELVERVSGLRRKSDYLEEMTRQGWALARAWERSAVELGAAPGDQWDAMTRHDARMKAEALDEVAGRADPANREWLNAMARGYRQQANE